MAIAVTLDDLLLDRRMTLTELADRIDITLAHLSILETGKARAIRFSTSGPNTSDRTRRANGAHGDERASLTHFISPPGAIALVLGAVALSAAKGATLTVRRRVLPVHVHHDSTVG